MGIRDKRTQGRIPLTIDAIHQPLLYEAASGASWSDAFPSKGVFAVEAEQWCRVAAAHGWWPHYLPRLRTKNEQRNQTLMELRVLYFLERIAGFQCTDDLEPPGHGPKRGEYLCVIDGRRVFCEVKCPTWQAAFVREQGQPEASRSRRQQPKYVDREFRPVDNYVDLWDSIKSAYPKMPADKPTLLIISDDLWLPLALEGDLTIDRVLHYNYREEGCFTSTDYERLGGIGFLDFDARTRDYSFRVFQNNYALETVRLPAGLLSQWGAMCGFCP